METRPSLSVTLLLNIQRKRNDTSLPTNLCSGSQIVSGKPTGQDPCIRVCFMILDRLILKEQAGFSMQRRLLLTMKRCS
jgi:hypothetical protein